ncbi:MAG: YciC family protein [Gemmatimonadales bacterium]
MTQPALRPLTLGEILDVSFGLYRHRAAQLLGVALVCTGIPVVLNVYLTASGGMLLNLSLAAVYLVLSLVLNSLATASTVFIVSESYLGRGLSAGRALERATPYIGRLLMLSLLTGLLVGIGFLLLLVPGIILLAGLILGPPVLVLEGSAAATDAMGRSWALSRGSRGKILGLLITMALLVYIPVIALGTIAGLVFGVSGVVPSPADPSAPALAILIASVGGVVQILLYPMVYCALTVLYYDLRVRKEGFDLEVLASALQTA